MCSLTAAGPEPRPPPRARQPPHRERPSRRQPWALLCPRTSPVRLSSLGLRGPQPRWDHPLETPGPPSPRRRRRGRSVLRVPAPRGSARASEPPVRPRVPGSRGASGPPQSAPAAAPPPMARTGAAASEVLAEPTAGSGGLGPAAAPVTGNLAAPVTGTALALGAGTVRLAAARRAVACIPLAAPALPETAMSVARARRVGGSACRESRSEAGRARSRLFSVPTRVSGTGGSGEPPRCHAWAAGVTGTSLPAARQQRDARLGRVTP